MLFPVEVLLFSDAGASDPSVTFSAAHRYVLREALNELFELVVEAVSRDPAVDPHSMVGQFVRVHLPDEPVHADVEGLVCQLRQLSAVAEGQSRYELTIVPLAWLGTRRPSHAIYQHATVAEIAQGVLFAGSGAQLEPSPPDPAAGKFAYFADNRSLRSDGEPPFYRSVFESQEPSRALGRSADKHAFLTGLLADLVQEHGLAVSKAAAQSGLTLRSRLPDPLSGLRTAIATLMPDLRLLGVEPAGERVVVLFEGRDGAERELGSLSASEQQAVLFATAWWRAQLNESVVLIDEPELHIHPREHTALLRALGALGSHNQLIVATSSDAITQAAKSHERITLSRDAH